jgi:hypothetical protein
MSVWWSTSSASLSRPSTMASPRCPSTMPEPPGLRSAIASPRCPSAIVSLCYAVLLCHCRAAREAEVIQREPDTNLTSSHEQHTTSRMNEPRCSSLPRRNERRESTRGTHVRRPNPMARAVGAASTGFFSQLSCMHPQLSSVMSRLRSRGD